MLRVKVYPIKATAPTESSPYVEQDIKAKVEKHKDQNLN